MYQKKKRNQKNSLLLFFNILLGNSFLFILCGRSTAEAPNDEIHDNGKNDEKRNGQQSVHVQIKVARPVIWIITDGCLSFCGGVGRISRWSSLFNARSHLQIHQFLWSSSCEPKARCKGKGARGSNLSN